jgi:hypothetical protein
VLPSDKAALAVEPMDPVALEEKSRFTTARATEPSTPASSPASSSDGLGAVFSSHNG